MADRTLITGVIQAALAFLSLAILVAQWAVGENPATQ
jgi:hypothetical protein